MDSPNLVMVELLQLSYVKFCAVSLPERLNASALLSCREQSLPPMPVVLLQMHIQQAGSTILVVLATLAVLPQRAMGKHAPALGDIVTAAKNDYPAIVFAMADQQALVQVPSLH